MDIIYYTRAPPGAYGLTYFQSKCFVVVVVVVVISPLLDDQDGQHTITLSI